MGLEHHLARLPLTVIWPGTDNNDIVGAGSFTIFAGVAVVRPATVALCAPASRRLTFESYQATVFGAGFLSVSMLLLSSPCAFCSDPSRGVQLRPLLARAPRVEVCEVGMEVDCGLRHDLHLGRCHHPDCQFARLDLLPWRWASADPLHHLQVIIAVNAASVTGVSPEEVQRIQALHPTPPFRPSHSSSHASWTLHRLQSS